MPHNKQLIRGMVKKMGTQEGEYWEIILAVAEREALEGRAGLMESSLDSATRFASDVGKDITARVAEIRPIGYRNGVEIELSTALECAQIGNAALMSYALDLARLYARNVDLNINDRIAEVEKALKK